MPPKYTEVAIVTWSADPEEWMLASFANMKRIYFKWHNSGLRITLLGVVLTH